MGNALLAAVVMSLLQSACPPGVRPAPEWRSVVDSTGEYWLRVPPSLEPAEPGKHFFVHGGDVWEDEEASVSISFGHWAETSFEEMPGERCWTRISGTDVFLIVSPDAVLAWYANDPGRHEPVVRVSAKKGEVGALAAVALSLERAQ